MHQCAQKTMKIKCNQKQLNNSLNIVKNIVGKNMPILSCILLSASNDKLQLTTTNLEIYMKHSLSAEVEKDGQIAIPTKLLSDFVEKLPDGNIYLELKKNILEIRCKGFKSKINGLDAEEFPVIPEEPKGEFVSMKNHILKDALQKVVSMASKSEARPEIGGIFVNSKEGEIKFVATDSFRLSEQSVESSINLGSFILPQQSAYELIKILNEDKEVKIFLTSGQALFDNGDTQLFARLIDGQYPDYQGIIPKDFQANIVVNRNDLINNITIASLFSERTNEIVLDIDSEQSVIKVSSASSEKGQNESELKADIDGISSKIYFNYQYILDGLNNIFSDKVNIFIEKDSLKTIISPIGDKSYIYLAMPLKK